MTRPIPGHLQKYRWYAPHQAWLRDRGLPHHNPGGAPAVRADLDGARLDYADIDYARLDYARLDRAHLDGASLVGACLDGVGLFGARLRGAYLVGASLVGACLRSADLSRANLRSADLNGATLRGATLRRANLRGAHLDGARLEGAHIDGVTGLPDLRRPGLAAAVLQQITEHPDTWDQSQWHCQSKHCAAGWACVLAEVAPEIEDRLGTAHAARLALGLQLSEPAPFGPNDAPIPWLRKLVEREREET